MNKNEDRKVPDHTLMNADPQSKDEPPQVYAVTDLRTFVKPELDEKLRGSGSGKSGTVAVRTQTICSCVPVETCVCNTVTYGGYIDVEDGVIGPGVGGCGATCACECTCTATDCACQCTCTGTALYWFPY